MTTKSTAAAIYCRISHDRTGEGLGVGRQEVDCRAWAQAQGWRVAEVYVDDDISAYSGKPRPSYRRLLADINDGRRDGLVVWHPDRLHRSPRELEDFIDLIERTGLPVGTVTAGDIDLTTPTGRMTARIVGAVARHESDHKSERIRRKHLELAENGQVPGGGIRPFGFESDRRTLRMDEAALVREAAERVLAGDGLRTICVDWSGRGIRTVTGAQWSGTTLKRMLTSARIAGRREHRGKITKAEWPGIIDAAMSRRLRRLLDDPARSTVDTTARVYLLAGIVLCGTCGSRMMARPVRRKGHRYRRYACTKEAGGCGGVGIGAQPLEDLIVEALMLRLDTPVFARKVAKRKVTAKSVDAAAGIEERLADLAEMYAGGDISKLEWAAARARLNERLEGAKAAAATQVREHVVTSQLAKPGRLRMEWSDMTLDRQRLILREIVDHITISATTRADNVFNPSRIDVKWRV